MTAEAPILKTDSGVSSLEVDPLIPEHETPIEVAARTGVGLVASVSLMNHHAQLLAPYVDDKGQMPNLLSLTPEQQEDYRRYIFHAEEVGHAWTEYQTATGGDPDEQLGDTEYIKQFHISPFHFDLAALRGHLDDFMRGLGKDTDLAPQVFRGLLAELEKAGSLESLPLFDLDDKIKQLLLQLPNEVTNIYGRFYRWSSLQALSLVSRRLSPNFVTQSSNQVVGDLCKVFNVHELPDADPDSVVDSTETILRGMHAPLEKPGYRYLPAYRVLNWVAQDEGTLSVIDSYSKDSDSLRFNNERGVPFFIASTGGTGELETMLRNVKVGVSGVVPAQEEAGTERPMVVLASNVLDVMSKSEVRKLRQSGYAVAAWSPRVGEGKSLEDRGATFTFGPENTPGISHGGQELSSGRYPQEYRVMTEAEILLQMRGILQPILEIGSESITYGISPQQTEQFNGLLASMGFASLEDAAQVLVENLQVLEATDIGVFKRCRLLGAQALTALGLGWSDRMQLAHGVMVDIMDEVFAGAMQTGHSFIHVPDRKTPQLTNKLLAILNAQ